MAERSEDPRHTAEPDSFGIHVLQMQEQRRKQALFGSRMIVVRVHHGETRVGDGVIEAGNFEDYDGKESKHVIAVVGHCDDLVAEGCLGGLEPLVVGKGLEAC